MPVESENQAKLNKHLEDIGWGLFLIMIGGLWLVPEATVPHGAWLFGSGLILLGINAVRHIKGIPINIVSTTLGFLALVAGFGEVSGVRLPLFPIALVAIGLMFVFKPFFTRTA